MKLNNVQIQGSHALIKGKIGTYSVHLGSAIVHRQPGGSLCILPEDLKLELVADPEIAGDQQLFVYIFTSLPVTDALQKFDESDKSDR